MALQEIHDDYCTCGDCGTGRAVPITRASNDQIAAMLSNRITNRSGTTLQVTLRYDLEPRYDTETRSATTAATLEHVEVQCEEHGRRWEIEAHQLPVNFAL